MPDGLVVRMMAAENVRLPGRARSEVGDRSADHDDGPFPFRTRAGDHE